MRVQFLKVDNNLWEPHAQFLQPADWATGVKFLFANGLELEFIRPDGPTIRPCLKPYRGSAGYKWWNDQAKHTVVEAEIIRKEVR